jgi:ferredoxin--NADP+ reductase
VEEYADEVFERMGRGAHIYVCGLRGMMPGILGMFEAVCQRKGLLWADTLKGWKEAGQWHVEVY